MAPGLLLGQKLQGAKTPTTRPLRSALVSTGPPTCSEKENEEILFSTATAFAAKDAAAAMARLKRGKGRRDMADSLVLPGIVFQF